MGDTPPPPHFKGYIGVIHRYTVSFTILNMLVDAVIQHWVTVVAPMGADAEVIGETLQELVAYLYADDGIVVSPLP